MRALKETWRDRLPVRGVIRHRRPGVTQQLPMLSPEPTPPNRFRHVPSDAELSVIPLVEPTVLEISDRDTLKLRRRLYRLNKDNALWRYRTMRENGLTLLWRLTR